MRRVSPYFRNLRKEISKSPVAYFQDLGLRNFSINHFGTYGMLHEMGFLFQNLLYNLLRERTRRDGGTVHFWRTKDKAEVDFVIDRGDSVIPVEVKCREMTKKEIGRSLRGVYFPIRPCGVVGGQPGSQGRRENRANRRAVYTLL
ncbi:MAG: DUF4143 domain-containing protein [Candidatus Moduliflexus flocculans]|nr:DUF4143 domain-containing protein [Candidatus Moduliflexus flocculans]